MPHAIIRGRNGRRHEVNFGDEAIRVEIYHSEETVEILTEFRDAPRGASALRPYQHSPRPVQRSHRRSDATFCEPSSCILDVLRIFDIPAELGPASNREGGPPVGFARSIDRACRGDDDFAPCGWP
jgi:hypothetical protein